jgi:hypothetical protein
MAEKIVVDFDKVQQISSQLSSREQAVNDLPPGPRPSGPLGNTGALESALSELESGVATVKQGVAAGIGDSARAFAQLRSDSIQADQQQAQQAQEMRTT